MPPRSSSLLREMWPVLSMMRLLGWLPAHRRHDSDTLHVRAANLVYCGIVLTVQLVPALYFVVKGFMMTSQLDPDLHLKSYMQLLCGVLLAHLYPVLTASHVLQHVTFCNEMRTFQLDVERLSMYGRPLMYGVRGASLVAPVLCLLPGAIVMVAIPLVVGRKPTWTVDLLMSMSFMNNVLLMAWWTIAMKALRVSSQRLIEEYKLLQDEYYKAGRQLDQLAMSTRPLWLQLCRLVRGSGHALGRPLALLGLNSFAILLYCLYSVLNTQTSETTVFFLVMVTSCASTIYLVCTAAQRVTDQVRLGLNEAMSATSNLRLSYHVRDQLLRYFIHLSRRSPEVTLRRGYLTIGRGLLSTLVAALVSNLVVLYQLKITERRLNVSDFFTFGDQNAL